MNYDGRMGMLRKIKRRQQKQQDVAEELIAAVALHLSRPEGRKLLEPWILAAAEADGLTAEQARRGMDAFARLIDLGAMSENLAAGGSVASGKFGGFRPESLAGQREV